MENLIKAEIKLICLYTDDEEDYRSDKLVVLKNYRNIDLDISVNLTEDNYNKLVALIKDLGAEYNCIKVGYVRPFVITAYDFNEAERISDVIQEFLKGRITMTTKKNVTVYIYYGDNPFQYMLTYFNADGIDCDKVYDSIVNGPFGCSSRSSKEYSNGKMSFNFECSNKDNAEEIFGIIERLYQKQDKNKIGVLVNINFKSCLFDDDCMLQFDKKISIDDYYKIVAFLKDCDLVKNPLEIEDFDTLKIISVICSTKPDALTIKKGLNGIVKKSSEPVNKVDDTLVNEEDSTSKNNSISSEIDYIAKSLDDTDLFLQLAEEAAELSQACLKYVRAYRGNNPTKDSADVYLKNIIEELTDVRVSADALNIEEDIDIYINKVHRWADRIRSKNAGEKK